MQVIILLSILNGARNPEFMISNNAGFFIALRIIRNDRVLSQNYCELLVQEY
jgi:hypothetical protein